MTQANLLEQAKSGDPNAIATLMNRTLQPKGITATVERQGDRLIVQLAAAQVPNRQAMTTFVQNGILGLKPQAVQVIEIQGRQADSDRAAWTQEIYLSVPDAPAPASESEMPAPVRPAPPPLHPTPPPIPRLQPPAPVAPASPPAASLPEPIDRDPDPIAAEVVAPIETAALPPPINLHAAIPPGEAIDMAAPPRRRPPNLLLPLLILAIVSALVGAIVGYALWRDVMTPPPPTGSPSAAPSPSPIAPSPTSQSRSGSLQEATDRAAQAQALAQTAQSTDDWSLVASQWQQAIAQLKAVPASSPDYRAAQTRLAQAQTQLAAAQAQANRPIATNAPPDTTFTVSRAITCPTEAAGSQPIELSNVSFQQGNAIVGCISNNTNQPIATASIAYQGSVPATSPTASPTLPAPNPTDPPLAGTPADAATSTAPAGSSTLSFAELAPQRTAPFRGSIELDPQVTNITISAVNWTPAGAIEPQQLPTSLTLVR